MDVMSREQTLEFLTTHVKTQMLMKHLYAVEAGKLRIHAINESTAILSPVDHAIFWVC